MGLLDRIRSFLATDPQVGSDSNGAWVTAGPTTYRADTLQQLEVDLRRRLADLRSQRTSPDMQAATMPERIGGMTGPVSSNEFDRLVSRIREVELALATVQAKRAETE